MGSGKRYDLHKNQPGDVAGFECKNQKQNICCCIKNCELNLYVVYIFINIPKVFIKKITIVG